MPLSPRRDNHSPLDEFCVGLVPQRSNGWGSDINCNVKDTGVRAGVGSSVLRNGSLSIRAAAPRCMRFIPTCGRPTSDLPFQKKAPRSSNTDGWDFAADDPVCACRVPGSETRYITPPSCPLPNSDLPPLRITLQTSLSRRLSTFPGPSRQLHTLLSTNNTSPLSKMPAHQEALKSTLENKGVRFHLKAGSAKWVCTVLDRATQ